MFHYFLMDSDFEDLIEQTFIEGQIDGETMTLAGWWILENRRRSDSPH
jgi:hypothetical protein